MMLGLGVSWSASSWAYRKEATPAGDMHAPIMTLAWPAHLSHLDDLIPTLHSQVWWHHRLHTATNKWYVNCSPLL